MAKSTHNRSIPVSIQVKKSSGWVTVRTANFKTKRTLGAFVRNMAHMYGLPTRAVHITRGARINPESRADEIAAAGKLMRNFSGKDAKKAVRLTLPKLPSTVLRIGSVRGIIYDTVRDGKPLTYIHRFKANSRPLFAASHDGKQLFMIGGSYDFTARGIVDRDERD